MARFITSLTLILSFLPAGAAERRVPTIDDLLNLKSIGGAQISPDGTRIVYTQTEADFTQDAFVTQVWLADVQVGRDAATDPRREVVDRAAVVARRQVDRVHLGRGSAIATSCS